MKGHVVVEIRKNFQFEETSAQVGVFTAVKLDGLKLCGCTTHEEEGWMEVVETLSRSSDRYSKKDWSAEECLLYKSKYFKWFVTYH